MGDRSPAVGRLSTDVPTSKIEDEYCNAISEAWDRVAEDALDTVGDCPWCGELLMIHKRGKERFANHWPPTCPTWELWIETQ